MRAAKPQTNFNAGELSPRIFGRTDVDKYYSGVARMQNFLPLPFGGAQKTPGTMFVHEVRDSDKPARLADWVFGSRQAYVLQLNDSKIRFYKDHGIITGTTVLTITAITNANPGVVTSAAHGLSNGDHIFLSNIEGMTELNDREFVVANKTADTFQLADPQTLVVISTLTYGIFVTDTNVKLLCHMNTNFNDSSAGAATATVGGDAVIASDLYVFGGAAGKFLGTGYITFPDSANWRLDDGVAAQSWTVDFRVYFETAITTRQALIAQYANAGSNWQIFVGNGTTLCFNVNDAIVAETAAGGVFTTGQWYHVAVVNNAGTIKLFIDGVLQGLSGAGAAVAIPNVASTLDIGKDNSFVVNKHLGRFDEVRVTKNSARWTAGFTPPTTESVAGSSSASVETIYEIAHEYADDELFDLQTAQAGDIMYIAHGEHPPQKLSRISDASWTIADVVFQDGPYLDENETTTTLDPSGNSGSVTVTASATTGINDNQGFLSTDVGRLIRFHDGTNWCWLTITAYINTTSVTATVTGANHVVGANLGGNVATVRWRLGAWSDTTGWPAAVTFFQGRAWYAGTTEQPQNVWGSVSLDYENMDPGAAADADAVTYQINSSRVNIIKWLASGKRLVIGTEGEIFTLYSGTALEPATPTNVRADSETNYGSNGVTPVKIGSYNYYLQGDGKTLRELYYDFGIDSYRSVNKSILSEHITRGIVRQMAYQKSPFGVIYAVLEDGKMATLTREIEQEVNGWADQTTRSGDTYESVAVIPVDGYDEAWFVVSRVIGGVTKQYVEYQVNPNQDVEEDLEDLILMQSALTHEGAATIVNGLEHLEGATVAVLADGTKLSKTVSSGMISLGASYLKTHVGLPITGQIKLLPIEAGSSLETAQGMEKKASKVVVRVVNSLGIQVGEDGGSMESLLTDGNGAEPTTLQTGVFDVPSSLGWEPDQQILFECADPFPATLLLVVAYEFTSEEQL